MGASEIFRLTRYERTYRVGGKGGTHTMKKLPKVINVAWRELDNDDPYLAAYIDATECLDEDGPTDVGTYKLMNTRRLAKKVMVVG